MPYFFLVYQMVSDEIQREITGYTTTLKLIHANDSNIVVEREKIPIPEVTCLLILNSYWFLHWAFKYTTIYNNNKKIPYN